MDGDGDPVFGGVERPGDPGDGDGRYGRARRPRGSGEHRHRIGRDQRHGDDHDGAGRRQGRRDLHGGAGDAAVERDGGHYGLGDDHDPGRRRRTGAAGTAGTAAPGLPDLPDLPDLTATMTMTTTTAVAAAAAARLRAAAADRFARPLGRTPTATARSAAPAPARPWRSGTPAAARCAPGSGTSATAGPAAAPRRRRPGQSRASTGWTLRLTGDGEAEATAALVFLVEAAEPAGMCAADDDTRCLGDSRFAVEVEWRAGAQGGPGKVVHEGTNDSALFWFFEPGDNWEVLLKVLDGCDVNGKRLGVRSLHDGPGLRDPHHGHGHRRGEGVPERGRARRRRRSPTSPPSPGACRSD